MKRSQLLAFVLLLLTGGSGAALVSGCGAGDEPPRIEKSRLQPAQPLDETPDAVSRAEEDRREALAEKLYVRAPGAEGPGDVRADYRECQARYDARPDMQDAHPLVQIAWIRDCMREKGWAMDPDADVPQG